MSARAALLRLDDLAAAGEDVLLALLHGLVAAFVTLAVVYRYVLEDPLVWSEEVILLLFGWMVFIGVASAFRHRTHIVIDFIVLIAPGRVGAVLGAVATAITLVLLVVLAWFGGRYFLREWPNLSPMLGVSAGWAILPLALGCGLSILHLARNLAESGPRGAVWFSDITARD